MVVVVELVVLEVEDVEDVEVVEVVDVRVVVFVVVEVDEVVHDALEHPAVVVFTVLMVVTPSPPLERKTIARTDETQRMPIVNATASVIRLGIPVHSRPEGLKP